MDVLRPPLLWIDGRCFRTISTVINKENSPVDEEEFYPDPPSENSYNEPCENKYDITTIRDEYCGNCSVPNAYYGIIIGAKGTGKKRIEFDTRTRILVPNFGDSGPIRVTGKTKRNVISALNRIELIVEAARRRQPFTHFLSVPFIEERMKDAFVDFRNDVLRECDGARGVEKSLFQNPDKLHLTIGTMPLMDNLEREKAVGILQDCKEIINAIVCSKPLKVCVRGIEYMNDDPSEVDVLYAKLDCSDGSNKLQMLVDQLVEKFVGEGLMQRQYDQVKLHVTIMNSLFRREPSGFDEFKPRDKSKNKQRETFDATRVLEKFGDHLFGEYAVSGIHLSQRHTMGRDGFYACTGSLDLPS